MYVALHQIQIWAQVVPQHESEITPNNPNHKLLIKRSPASLHNTKDKSSYTSNKPHLLTTFNIVQNRDTVAHCCNTLWWHHNNMQLSITYGKEHVQTQHITLKLLLLLHYFLSKMVHFKLMGSVNPTTQCNIPEEDNPWYQHWGNLKIYIWSFIWKI